MVTRLGLGRLLQSSSRVVRRTRFSADTLRLPNNLIVHGVKFATSLGRLLAAGQSICESVIFSSRIRPKSIRPDGESPKHRLC